MPEAVSIVTGNQTASAMRAAEEMTAEGKTTKANGIQAVAGIGPTIFNTGIPQYRMRVDQPMQMPLTNPEITPRQYPLNKSARECHVLSKSRARSLIMLCRTAAGPGK